eukprot:gb/GEZN01003108.1/.p1 GENE.gb/GEZN01003108.1/~~gb/GEZN01003108.1/.p1  ORF type:complete len:672 (+),score=65.15 gb/GEZN01003108.1/:175-2190(+)
MVNLPLAASFVVDALDGVFIPQNNGCMRSAWWHCFGHHFYTLRLAAVFGLVVISLVEQPSWCFGNADSCGDPADFLRGMKWKLPVQASLPLELVCFSVLLVDVYVRVKADGWLIFRVNHYLAWRTIFVGISIFDVLIMAVLLLSGHPPFFRLSPLMRASLLITSVRSARDGVSAVFQSMQAAFVLLCIVFLYLISFAWFGYILFKNIEGDRNFKSFWDSFFNLQILLTTANFPDIMVPSYTQYRESAMYFIIFLVFGLYFLNPLVMSVAAHGFAVRREEFLIQRQQNIKNSMNEAFQILSRKRSGSSSELPATRVLALLNQVKASYKLVTLKNRMAQQWLEKWEENKDKLLAENAFERLAGFDVQTRFPFEGSDEEQSARLGPQHLACLTYTAPSCFVKLEGSACFRYSVDVLVVLNIVYFVWSTSELSGRQLKIKDSFEQVLLLLFTLEALLHIVVRGNEYFLTRRFQFDFFILVACYLCWGIKHVDTQVATFLFLARSFTLFRVLSKSKSLRQLMATFLKLLPKFASASVVLLALFMFYGSLGVQFFGGKIAKSNAALRDPSSSFGASNYYANSMNDLAAAFVTLFEIMVINNWFVIVNGYAAVTTVAASRTFFISFYVISVLIVLNTTTVFVMDMFLKELQKKGGLLVTLDDEEDTTPPILALGSATE